MCTHVQIGRHYTYNVSLTLLILYSELYGIVYIVLPIVWGVPYFTQLHPVQLCVAQPCGAVGRSPTIGITP